MQQYNGRNLRNNCFKNQQNATVISIDVAMLPQYKTRNVLTFSTLLIKYEMEGSGRSAVEYTLKMPLISVYYFSILKTMFSPGFTMIKSRNELKLPHKTSIKQEWQSGAGRCQRQCIFALYTNNYSKQFKIIQAEEAKIDMFIIQQ